MGTLTRPYYRALNKLEKLQKERAKEMQESAMLQTWASAATAPPAIGFVSQNAKVTASEQSRHTSGVEKPRAFHAGLHR
jgi:hypothetical protein